jgi:hypothetical protein
MPCEKSGKGSLDITGDQRSTSSGAEGALTMIAAL